MLKEKLNRLNSLEVFSGIGILLFLVGCPFFLSDRYYSMTQAKTMFFYGVSAFFAVGCLILRRLLRQRIRIPLVRKNRTEGFLCLFIGFAFLSFAFAVNRIDAFIGDQGRNMGLLMFLLIWAAYISVSRFGQFKKPVAMIFGASVVVMNLIAFLQFCRLDPFHLYRGTGSVVKVGFMTMLGNKDVYYSYLAMALPFSLYLIFSAESLREKIFWYAVGWTGFIGILICNCEGGYLCLPIVFLFFLLVKCRDKQTLLVFLRIVMLFFSACLLISCLRFNFARGKIKEELLTRLVLFPVFYCIGLPVSVSLYVLLMKKDLPEKLLPILKKTVTVFAAVCAAGVGGALLYFSFINKTADIGRFNVFFRMGSVKWGNGRGPIWRNLISIYARFPFFRKLFGAGEESVYALMKQYFPQQYANGDRITDNAHNEYLQYLVTHGLLGLASYLLFVISAVRRGFREGGRFQKAAALGAVCYLVQAFFNLLQALTTPMFFVFLALAQTADIAVPKKIKAAAADGAADVTAETGLPEPETAQGSPPEPLEEAPSVDEAAMENNSAEEDPVQDHSPGAINP